jgi:predicted AAA+ superfamily ATPase
LAQEVALGDIATVDGVRRDPVRVLSLLRSLARNSATEAAVATLAADAGRAGAPMLPETASTYLGALERLMIYEPLEAWSPILRDKARVRRKPVHHLVDPALAAALLGAGPAELGRDLKTFGLLFESLAARDLRVYASPGYARVHHYRDNTGLEVDLVVDAGYRRWAAFEVKLSGAAAVTDPAAKNLLRLASKVDIQSAGPPACLGVITAQGHAYTRPDGVCVVPLATLGP